MFEIAGGIVLGAFALLFILRFHRGLLLILFWLLALLAAAVVGLVGYGYWLYDPETAKLVLGYAFFGVMGTIAFVEFLVYLSKPTGR